MHDKNPLIGPSGSGARVDNAFVVFATGNRLKFSEDMLNRTVSIRLEVKGDVTRRSSTIGDPKNEYLPANEDRIRAELLGIIAAWDAAGRPPFTGDTRNKGPWASAIGGMLELAGFGQFLANDRERRTADDPISEALATLGSAYPDEWLTATDWSARIAALGFTKVLIKVHDRESNSGRARGTGLVLSDREDVELTEVTEAERMTLRVQKSRARFKGKGRNPLPVRSPDARAGRIRRRVEYRIREA